MLANNFDTDLSDEDDDMNFYAEDHDVYEDEDAGYSNGNNGDSGWSNHAKGSIELGSIGADTLTLEEMNG